MPDKLFCPSFIYEICVASAVKNFLTESYSLDMLGKKYAEGISEHYKPISTEEISGPAEEILRFLSDRKNPMFEAHDLANHYVYWKLNFDGRSQRKLKGIHGFRDDDFLNNSNTDTWILIIKDMIKYKNIDTTNQDITPTIIKYLIPSFNLNKLGKTHGNNLLQ